MLYNVYYMFHNYGCTEYKVTSTVAHYALRVARGIPRARAAGAFWDGPYGLFIDCYVYVFVTC